MCTSEFCQMYFIGTGALQLLSVWNVLCSLFVLLSEGCCENGREMLMRFPCVTTQHWC